MTSRWQTILLLSSLATAVPAFGQGGFPVAVETTTVQTSELQSSVTAVGTLIAEASATLRAEVPGQILGIHFEEGQPVSAGARLFTIEATVLEADVNEARANADRSEAAYKRARELFGKKLISATDYDAARANYDVDMARLHSSEARLSKKVVKAPFDGFVGLRRINIGDYAQVGQELVDIVQLDPLRVDFSLPETLVAKVRPGLTIDVTADAYQDDVFVGKITAVAPSSDVEGHNIEVRASLPNGDLKLRPGMFVRVDVSLGVKEHAILVPEQAIWPIGQDKTVFVVVDGKAQRRVVTLGARQPGKVEVVSGLAVGDVVVTAGQLKLYEGATVNPVGSVTATPAADN
ncbi:MAG: efflux RND transporter periplasmic adaptor subunit [Woeseiaceae bacterium]